MKANAKNVSTLAKRKQAENYDLRRYLKQQGDWVLWADSTSLRFRRPSFT